MLSNSIFETTHLREKNESNDLHVYVYQPNEDFYHMNFQKRLQILCEKIAQAHEHFKANSFETDRALFIAPEYLFKDFSKVGPERYYSEADKEDYLKALINLSLKYNMIIAPGTMCWKKEHENQFYYQNAMYLINAGKVHEYKKYNPYPPQDYDFGKDNNYFKYAKFFSRGNLNNMVEINGLNIGIEICYDNFKNTLKSSKNTDKLDIHLIVADGLTELKLLDVANITTIKIEKNPQKNPNILIDHQQNPTQKLTQVGSELHSHIFSNVGKRAQNKKESAIDSPSNDFLYGSSII